VTSTKGASKVLLCLLLTAMGWPVVAGCDRGSQQQQAIQPLPATAEILFTSNRDTSASRKEIYAMDAQGGDVTRITFTNENHFVVGIDASKRYVAATRGTENKKRLWLLDLQTGEETPLTDAENHAEGRSFSPDGE